MIDAMQSGFGMLGLTTEQMTHLDRLPADEVEGIAAKALEIPAMQWSLGQRGPMVHGTDSAAGYLRTLPSYTLDGRVDSIRCPVLLTAAEGDALSSTAEALFDELRCPKRFVQFTDAEAAGGHCETQVRTRFQQVSLDWLDEVFAGHT